MSWQHAWETAAVATAVGSGLALSKNNAVRVAGAFLREAAVIGVLYGLWELAGRLSLKDVKGDAYARARWIQHFEHDIFLPSERSVQHLILGHPLLVQAENLYYAAMHFPMMFLFLIWLFLRHRDKYRPVRQVMAWTTLGCLLVQLIPVAPPRMLPGVVDTGLLYNQSVYSHGLPVDQLSAMPSVHVAWATCVGYYAWRVSTSHWRYIGFGHTAITVFVVVSTGNHWWLDGIVAVLILSFCAWTVYGARTGFHALIRLWRRRRAPASTPGLGASPETRSDPVSAAVGD
jgi:PAP2 superfamily